MNEEVEIGQLLKAFAFNDMVYEQQQAMRSALLAFLDVLASFDRCLVAMDPKEEVSPVVRSWRGSVEKVRSQLLMALEQAGVSFMNCVGQIFDPVTHEAVEIRVTSDVEENTILEEIVRGCTWRGEILCYAKVVVASNTPRHSGISDNQKEI